MSQHTAPQRPQVVVVQQKGISGGAAAILSFFIPGLGQLCQGRWIMGFLAFVLTLVGYMLFIVPGLIFHLLTIVDAARK